jgi:repressor LexA
MNALTNTANPFRWEGVLASLTHRQREILDLIAWFQELNGYAPTTRELAELTGIKSTNGIAEHLKALRRKGAVTWVEGKNRTLKVLR